MNFIRVTVSGTIVILCSFSSVMAKNSSVLACAIFLAYVIARLSE